jgi:hypothetical protein
MAVMVTVMVMSVMVVMKTMEKLEMLKHRLQLNSRPRLKHTPEHSTKPLQKMIRNAEWRIRSEGSNRSRRKKDNVFSMRVRNKNE